VLIKRVANRFYDEDMAWMATRVAEIGEDEMINNRIGWDRDSTLAIGLKLGLNILHHLRVH